MLKGLILGVGSFTHSFIRATALSTTSIGGRKVNRPPHSHPPAPLGGSLASKSPPCISQLSVMGVQNLWFCMVH